ncbi:MAG: hypothetical protein WKF55_10675 [Gemmatimonadaceae bacterium]
MASPNITGDGGDPVGRASIFSGRSILMISPQAWNGLKLSKHHYAVELANSGSEVFFLNPPSQSGFRPRISRGPSPHLWIVDYSQLSRGTRFLPAAANARVDNLQARIIQRALQFPLDVVWSFDPSRFTTLTHFDAKLHLFHAVDRVDPGFVEQIAASAAAVMSVSDVILDDFASTGVPRFFVHHGLSSEYAALARRQSPGVTEATEGRLLRPHRVGYVGNLLRPDIDHSAFCRIVGENPEIEFHLWGPYEYASLNWKSQDVPAVVAFVSFLMQQKNVVLHGLTPPSEVAIKIFEMDVLLVCYDPRRERNLASNNHKVLEYLSTGRPVVSNHISTYVRPGVPEGLLCMPETLHNEELPELFQRVISTLDALSTDEMRQRRIRFALANTYSQQLRTIDSLSARLLR